MRGGCAPKPRVGLLPHRGRRHGPIHRLRDGPQQEQPHAAVGQAPREGVAQDALRLHARPLRGDPDGHDRGPRRGRPQLPLPLASDGIRGRRREVRQRARHGHPADRILVRGAGPARRDARHGHPLVRRGRRGHLVPDADLLLGAGGPRVFPRGQRLDARIFAHVGVLALQPHDQFRLHALRYDLRGHPQGHGQVGERHAPQRAGAQRPSRKNVARGTAAATSRS